VICGGLRGMDLLQGGVGVEHNHQEIVRRRERGERNDGEEKARRPCHGG